MSDAPRRGKKHSTPEIDISKRASAPGLGWRGNVGIWGGMFLLFFALVYLQLPVWWSLAVIVSVGALAILGRIAWFVVIKRGALTWMRLAQRPAKLMARGHAEAARAAYAKALARARRFASEDRRRAAMMCELAMFAKNQGQLDEALALYEESSEILFHYLATEPFDYFVVLNNYAICFIHLKDYEAAQRLLEKAVDLTLAARKTDTGAFLRLPLQQVQSLELVLHLNLAVLFMEMHELAEAEVQLRDADALMPLLSKRMLKGWGDHYVGICALWEFESGHFAEAQRELQEASDPNYPVCLRVQAKLLLLRREFAEAERLQRKYQELERKKGTLLRPELLKLTLEFAESLLGQGKHADAIAALKDARAIVANFKIPADNDWRSMLEPWVQRAKDLQETELAATLEEELRNIPDTASPAITLRINHR